MTAVSTRAATEQDEAFLFELFKAVRSADFGHLALPPAQLEMLLNLQYAGQKRTYRARYPEGDRIILLGESAIGRIWLHEGPAEHHLVDIALLPEFQNCGIGSALVGAALAAARSAKVPLRCSIAVANQGSLEFHQRLGFRVTGRDEVYYDLVAE